MKEYNVVAIADKLEDVREALRVAGVPVQRVTDTKYLDRLETRGKVNKKVSAQRCCGNKTKKKIKYMEVPKHTFKDRLMAWSYKNISNCLFCAGMRLGLYIGIILTGIFILIIGR